MTNSEKYTRMDQILINHIGHQITVNNRTFELDFIRTSGTFCLYDVEKNASADPEVIYCTPFYENTDGIAIAVYKDDDYNSCKPISFDVTENTETDLINFFLAMQLFLIKYTM